MLAAQSCPTVCDPLDCSPPGSSVHGILQARILDGFPFPSPGDLPAPGMKPGSPALQADSLPSELQESPGLTFIQRLIRNFLVEEAISIHSNIVGLAHLGKRYISHIHETILWSSFFAYWLDFFSTQERLTSIHAALCSGS